MPALPRLGRVKVVKRRHRLVGLILAVGGGCLLAPVAWAALAPTATTGGASNVQGTTATVSASVNPRGQATTVAFDYGTSAAYGRSTATQSAGSGSAATTASASPTGLQPQTTYHYRVVAANATGTVSGADATFTTLAPPAVKTGAASAVTGSSATLTATVTPSGQPTTVVFEYGATTAYGKKSVTQDAGQGTAAVTLKATISGLAAGTRYHVRARATNATGITSGNDVAFTTLAAAAPTISTGATTGIAATSATFNGSVNPHGVATQVYAEHGTSTRYGTSTPRTDIGGGSTAVPVRITAVGLKPGTVHHYRLVAVNAGGRTSRGRDVRFTTARAIAVGRLVATPNPVAYGRGARIAGTVTGAGSARAPVTLLGTAFPFSATASLAAGAAGANGAFAIGVGSLPVTTRVAARVVVGGATVTSAALRVGVRPAVRLTVRRVAGGRVRFSGVIRPGRAATVYLRKVGPRTTVTLRRVRARGGFAITIPGPRVRSTYRIRVRTDSRALQRFDSAPRTLRGR